MPLQKKRPSAPYGFQTARGPLPRDPAPPFARGGGWESPRQSPQTRTPTKIHRSDAVSPIRGDRQRIVDGSSRNGSAGATGGAPVGSNRFVMTGQRFCGDPPVLEDGVVSPNIWKACWIPPNRLNGFTPHPGWTPPRGDGEEGEVYAPKRRCFPTRFHKRTKGLSDPRRPRPLEPSTTDFSCI